MAAGKRRTLAWEQEYPSNTFTDRESYREMMRNAVVAPQALHEDRVMMIYGAGGMGKSALKDYFIKQILEKEDLADAVYASIDFEYEEKTRNVEEATVRMARDLIEKGKIPLPAFSLGFIRYMMKTSPETNLQTSYAYLFKFRSVEGDLAGYAFEKLIEYGVDEVRAGASLIPGVGFLIKKASEKGHAKMLEWLQKSSAGKVLQGIDEMLPGELRNKLPIWLAYDIQTYLQAQTDADNAYPWKRIVIIMDGFEWLWAREHHKADKTRELDEWVRQFMINCPGVLYMMFGREKLRWETFHEMFTDEEGFRQLSLQGLDQQDARVYLEKCGVKDQGIQAVMIENAIDHENPKEGCLPFYLDIMARTHWAILQGGGIPAAQDFARLGDEVIRHFFQHLSEDMTTAIKVLACAPFIDEEIFRKLVEGRFISPNVSLKTLYSFSFIRQDGAKAGMHGLMKELASAMYAEESTHQYQAIHRLLFAYFDAQLPTEQKEMTGQMEQDLANAAASIRILSTAEFRSWIIDKAMLYYGHNNQETLPVLLQQALADSYILIRSELGKDEVVLGDRPRDESMELAMLNYCMASYYHDWDDEHQKAIPYVDQAILFTEFYLGALDSWSYSAHGKTIKEIALDCYILQGNILTQLNKYIAAGKIYAKARGHAAIYRLYFDNTPYANYLVKAGRLAEAEPLMFDQLAYAEDMMNNPELRHLWVEHRGYLAHEIARMLREDGRFDEALRYHQFAFEVYSQTRTEGHPYIAVVKAELAKTLIESGENLDRASAILQEVYPVLTRSYEEDNLHIANYKMHLFELLLLQGDSDKANQYYYDAVQILRKKIGRESRANYTGILKLFLPLNEKRKSREISEEEYLDAADILLSMILPALENLKNLFSVYNPLLIKILTICAEALVIKGRVTEAEKIQRTIDECDRISRDRVGIRLAGLDTEQVWDDKSELLQVLSLRISLPNNGNVDVLRIELPFYKELSLYKIIYKNAATTPRRYVLCDGKNTYPIDYNPSTIEKLGAFLDLTPENALLYLRFYYDASCDDKGFVFIIQDKHEIPWRLDVPISDNEKKRLTEHIKPYKILSVEHDRIRAEAYFIINDELRLGQFDVGFDGKILKGFSEQCYFRPGGEIVFLDRHFGPFNEGRTGASYHDQDYNTVTIDPGEQLITVFPAGLDPKYVEQPDYDHLSDEQELSVGAQGCVHFLRFLAWDDVEKPSDWEDLNNELQWLISTNDPGDREWLHRLKLIINRFISVADEHKASILSRFTDDRHGQTALDNYLTSFHYYLTIIEKLLAKAD